MSWKVAAKKGLSWLLVLGIVVVSGETAIRVFFAFMVGPSVLAYGTPGYGGDVRQLPGAAMRVFGLHNSPDPENQAAGYRKFRPHEVKTDHDEHGKEFHPTINSRGFRGEEFSIEKTPGVIRVVTLGASSTFGYRDRDDETYPYYMESILNARTNNGQQFEVINLGVPHINTDHIRALFLNEALPLQPDVVTFYEGINDAGEGISSVMEQRAEPGKRKSLAGAVFSSFGHRMLGVAFLESVLYYSTALSPHTQEDVDNLAAANVPRFISNVSAIRDECEKRGIVFVVATQQAKSDSKYRIGKAAVDEAAIRGVTYQQEVDLVRQKLADAGTISRRETGFLVHDAIMRELRVWASANQVPLADVIQALDDQRDVLLSWVHLSPAGNRVVAEEFAEAILASLTPD